MSFFASCKNQNPETLATQGFPGSLFFFAGSTLRNVYGRITYSISTLGSSISIELGRKHAENATMMMPVPQMMNHFSTPNFSARGPEITSPRVCFETGEMPDWSSIFLSGMARDSALVSSEKTLPRILRLDFFLKNRVMYTIKRGGKSHTQTAYCKYDKRVRRRIAARGRRATVSGPPPSAASSPPPPPGRRRWCPRSSSGPGRRPPAPDSR